MFQIIDLSAPSTLLLFPCKLFFISIIVSFIYDWIFCILVKPSLSSLSILITSILNSAFDRLLISISFSSFSGVLICSFTWAMFISSFGQPPCVCFYVLGRAALTLCRGSVAKCSRCSVGSRGTASPITQARYLRCALHVG